MHYHVANKKESKLTIISKCTCWSAESESEAQEEGAERAGIQFGLLEIVGFVEVMAEGVRAGTHLDSGRERITDCIGAATLKLQASNEIHTNGMQSRLVFDNVRE